MPGFQITKTIQFNIDYEGMDIIRKKAADSAIAFIAKNPQAGEAKRLDLSGEYVYTFPHETHLMLLSYRYDAANMILVSLEVRQGFFKKT